MSRTGSGSFSDWMNKKNPNNNEGNEDSSFLSQVYDIQTNFTTQMQEMSGIFPDAGPLSASFRVRIRNAVYLLLGSILFGCFAIFIGIPTIAVRPSKFALCSTISTLLAIASIIVLQTPTTFLDNIWTSGRGVSLCCLCLSSLMSIYFTIFVHRYILTLSMAGVQVFCLIWFIASFIPGGRRGLSLLLRATFSIARALLSPLLSMCTTIAKNGFSWLLQ
jgi:hypothetical protein